MLIPTSGQRGGWEVEGEGEGSEEGWGVSEMGGAGLGGER